MKIKLFIDCQKAGHVCDRAQYSEASVYEHFLLRIHILYCTTCKEHSTRNQKLTQFIERANLQTLDEEERAALREMIERELSQ